MGRTRMKLPVINKLLSTHTAAKAKEALQQLKARQGYYYNHQAKERRPLAERQTVRVKFHQSEPHWRKAEIQDVLPYRCYNFQFPDRSVRRRRSKHIRFSDEEPIWINDQDHSYQWDLPDGAGATSLSSHVPQPPPPSQEQTTRAVPGKQHILETRTIESY